MGILECLLWLTLNVYHEARGDGDDSQRAVAHVTLNRAREKGLPIKEVVTEPAQFSWYGRVPILPNDPDAFVNCLTNALIALRDPDPTGGATHYHHLSVDPWWAGTMEVTGRFGTHFFYR